MAKPISWVKELNIKDKEIEEETNVPRDFMGTPITVGNIIIYPVRQSSSMWMSRAIVTNIVEYGCCEHALDVLVASYSWRKENYRLITEITSIGSRKFCPLKHVIQVAFNTDSTH